MEATTIVTINFGFEPPIRIGSKIVQNQHPLGLHGLGFSAISTCGPFSAESLPDLRMAKLTLLVPCVSVEWAVGRMSVVLLARITPGKDSCRIVTLAFGGSRPVSWYVFSF
jgi:hypothetical protein